MFRWLNRRKTIGLALLALHMTVRAGWASVPGSTPSIHLDSATAFEHQALSAGLVMAFTSVPVKAAMVRQAVALPTPTPTPMQVSDMTFSDMWTDIVSRPEFVAVIIVAVLIIPVLYGLVEFMLLVMEKPSMISRIRAGMKWLKPSKTPSLPNVGSASMTASA